MSYSIITEVHTLNDASDRVAATVAACLLQATNTTNCDKAGDRR